MTGRYASHTGLQHNVIATGSDVGLPLKFKTLPQHLNEVGYVSHAVGKWHLGRCVGRVELSVRLANVYSKGA